MRFRQLRSMPPPAPAANGQSHAEYERAERRRQARERNARIEAMTKVADLAAEVEELVAKRATNEVLLESTRALVSISGLEQIGTGGERTLYDASLHDPIGDTPDDGNAVIVVRPGFRWKAPGEVICIAGAGTRGFDRWGGVMTGPVTRAVGVDFGTSTSLVCGA